MNISRVVKSTCMFLALAMLVLSGCASHKVHTKSSVVDYLYPKLSDTEIMPSIPHLKLPLRVGVAFVPESSSKSHASNFWTGQRYAGSISEAKKSDLLEEVATYFRGLDFVDSIDVIPTAYLTPGGGFDNLSQIQTMYGIDVIALVSYDQVQFTDEGMLSFSYWTIVGAYVVSGEKNDTNTLMDTVVYDIASKKMLFRAPGTSKVTGKSTPVNLSEELRADSVTGFEQAAKSMVINLQTQLSKFRESIKNNPAKAKVSHREGYTGGGGAVAIMDLLVLLSLSLLYSRRKLGRAAH
ncbi:rhombotarget lipoprotein [Teredinibacter haidensis]|uniref:rhombotarget lipoprotein n=1 Tax=Teredinibacter haidensis TaxID=2731755 RepID=UPI000948B8D8|nr:rhombotarget lipoprotein [Teredinibacter haidensis]